MSSARMSGESYEDYRKRLKGEKIEEMVHVKGVMAWPSTRIIERDGKKIRQSRTFINSKTEKK